MLFSEIVISLILGTIGPLFDTLTVLLILTPLADVSGAISMLIGSVRLVVEPLALIDVTVSVDQLTMTIGLVTMPLTLVFTAILPDLLTESVLHAVKQITSVDGAVAERDGAVSLPRVIVHHFGSDSATSGQHATMLVIIILHNGSGSTTLEIVRIHHITRHHSLVRH